MACSGKMLEAANPLEHVHHNTPYAGGVWSFAKYMNGDVTEAETVARQALARGFQDPWTIHAIAHCLYSQGKPAECIQFLNEYRPIIQQSKPSAFMKGHMEFHQALCFIDLENVEDLHTLIHGPLWNDLTTSEREDYWNSSGLLGVQWKAELRGLKNPWHRPSIQQAMDILRSTNASATKSCVFSLCILRFTTGTFRKKWKEEILKDSDNGVLCDVARAVDLVYPSGERTTTNNADDMPLFSVESCSEAVEKYLAANVDKLDQLGASPEQREVIEEFLVVVAKAAGNGQLPIETIDMTGWTRRNHRPNVQFYKSILPDAK